MTRFAADDDFVVRTGPDGPHPLPPSKKRRNLVPALLTVVLLAGTATGVAVLKGFSNQWEDGSAETPGAFRFDAAPVPPESPASSSPAAAPSASTTTTTAAVSPSTITTRPRPPAARLTRPVPPAAAVLQLSDLPAGWHPLAAGSSEAGCISTVASRLASATASYQRGAAVDDEFVPRVLSAATAVPPGGPSAFLVQLGHELEAACGPGSTRSAVRLRVDHPPGAQGMGFTVTIREARSGATYEEISRVMAAGDTIGFVTLTVPRATPAHLGLADELAEVVLRRLGMKTAPLCAETYSVEAVYVVPNDAVDRGLYHDGTIQMSIGAAQRWLMQQTNGRGLRVVCAGNEPAVAFHRLAVSEAAVWGAPDPHELISHELEAAGFDDPTRIYALYYDGALRDYCGAAHYPPTTPGRVALLTVKAGGTCEVGFPASVDEPGPVEFRMVHEVFHALGAVPACAPHRHGAHVTDDRRDVMYTGPGRQYPAVLDAGRDDYFGHGRPGCVDLADSLFLHPSPPGALPPPGWPTPRAVTHDPRVAS